ncbi:hypothetical protein T4B_9862 [Trichinella pseudospiralis]|uniref:Uncharacterized protein n=2 Tax=Trichinella pseudospiralis TaxID=6337 RepID=A0A0V1ISJ1_TRIPS|nr:hypothetical protein T4A_5507 [Trichinella pseudospiralis]KRY86660.1 hypothetical protein T4D_14227 [Trichinella pseudospiralis]KRZ09798.1 hypothetical protein T4B_9862 [Trichinella pseudospiralis]KRZ25822.1 hypothetical protein T4C_11989 [Trichinella pseudospiralis]
MSIIKNKECCSNRQLAIIYNAIDNAVHVSALLNCPMLVELRNAGSVCNFQTLPCTDGIVFNRRG